MTRFFTKLISLIAIVGLCSFSDMDASTGGYALIINKDNPIKSMTAGEAKMFFLRKLKSRWPVINKNIRPTTRKNKCQERDAFYAAILKMTDAEVDTYFSERQFQNAEKQPDKFNSDAEVIDFVSQEIGSIGFVNAKSIGSSSSVKVVLEF